MKDVEPITNTKELIKELNANNILDYRNLIRISTRIDMLDLKYTFDLKDVILEKAEIIEANRLDEKYDSDIELKKELIDEIGEIAAEYGINLEEFLRMGKKEFKRQLTS